MRWYTKKRAFWLLSYLVGQRPRMEQKRARSLVRNVNISKRKEKKKHAEPQRQTTLAAVAYTDARKPLCIATFSHRSRGVVHEQAGISDTKRHLGL